MAPTIQSSLGNTSADASKIRQSTSDRRAASELVCRVKYNNTLPDIPFDPKFITYPFESNRFIEYNTTSLERNYKYEVLTEHDLGVTIDLINPQAYAVPHDAVLDPIDEKLLEEDVLTPQDSKRSRHHAKSVSWLRRTEYISTEQTRFQPQTIDKVEAKVGYSIKKILKDETLYMDRENQIKAIEKTFEDSKIPIEKHYSKPGIVPVEVLPVFPDFSLWKYPCAQVIFDSDPAMVGRSVPAQIEEMSQAMIRGVMDEHGEQFVAYFLPTEETLEKRRRDLETEVDYVDEDDYEYRMAREYNWNVKSKASKGYEENYFFIVREMGVYYNELETRVCLSRRRRQGAQQSNTKLVVQHRALNAAEHKMQRYRERQLEPPGEDEFDDNAESGNESDAGSQRSRSRSRSPRQDRGSVSGNESDARSRSRSQSPAEAGRHEETDAGSERGSKRSRSRSNDGSGSDSDVGSKRSRTRSRSGSRSSNAGSGAANEGSGNESDGGSRKSRSRSHSVASEGARSRSASPSGSGSAVSRSQSGSPASRSGSPASRSGSQASQGSSPASQRDASEHSDSDG